MASPSLSPCVLFNVNLTQYNQTRAIIEIAALTAAGGVSTGVKPPVPVNTLLCRNSVPCDDIDADMPSITTKQLLALDQSRPSQHYQ